MKFFFSVLLSHSSSDDASYKQLSEQQNIHLVRPIHFVSRALAFMCKLCTFQC